MRNFIKAGFVVLVAGILMVSACSSKSGNTNVMTGAGGGTAPGAGGATGGDDASVGAGGSTGTGGGAGTSGAGGSGSSAHQDHLNLINKATTGGIMVTRPAPVSYDSCKI